MNINILALTATATKETVQVLMERLCMTNVNVIGTTPDRHNIKYSVVHNQTAAELCVLKLRRW